MKIPYNCQHYGCRDHKGTHGLRFHHGNGLYNDDNFDKGKNECSAKSEHFDDKKMLDSRHIKVGVKDYDDMLNKVHIFFMYQKSL